LAATLWRAVPPPSSSGLLALTSAPPSIRSFITSSVCPSLWSRIASNSGVQPALSRAFTSVSLFLSRVATLASSPFLAATCSGVSPYPLLLTDLFEEAPPPPPAPASPPPGSEVLLPPPLSRDWLWAGSGGSGLA